MSQPQTELVFSTEDQAWIRREKIAVPKFWHGHSVPPLMGDVVRFGGRQFLIEARLWEQVGGATDEGFINGGYTPNYMRVQAAHPRVLTNLVTPFVIRDVMDGTAHGVPVLQ